jgi:hypothetical protein
MESRAKEHRHLTVKRFWAIASPIRGVAMAILILWPGTVVSGNLQTAQFDPLGSYVDDLKISVTIESRAAKAFDLAEEPLLTALKERANTIARDVKSKINIIVEESSVYFGPDPPGTPPWPKEIHAHFTVGIDPADPSAITVAVFARRGTGRAKVLSRSRPLKIDVRCEEPGCLYRKIADATSPVLRRFVWLHGP